MLAWVLWLQSESAGVSNHQRLHCLLKCLFRRRSLKTSKFRVTGLCEGNSPVAGEFPTQRASKAENVSIRWRHNGIKRDVRAAPVVCGKWKDGKGWGGWVCWCLVWLLPEGATHGWFCCLKLPFHGRKCSCWLYQISDIESTCGKSKCQMICSQSWALNYPLLSSCRAVYKLQVPQYSDVIMNAMVSQITGVSTVYPTVGSDAVQRKHQSSASPAFVRGIHRRPVFPAQKASNAKNVSIWWRNHVFEKRQKILSLRPNFQI